MDTSSLPLAGIRVLDLSQFWAGPCANRFLADMGAEVIKVESCHRPDPLRLVPRGLFPNGEPGEQPWNRSGMVNERNRNKLGLTLDLTKGKGVEIFKKLVKISDVVVENFSARVMKGFGLDYAVLKEINPRLIMASISSQGMSGPERDYVSLGNILEQTAGLCATTGYQGEPVRPMGIAFPDVLGSILGAGAIVTALFHRRRTGVGTYIDISQRQMVSCIVPESIMDYVMNGRNPSPMGNRHQWKAPHGCYRCKGEDRWVTIAVGTDEEWRSLCEVMGRPELAQDERFGNFLARYKQQDELDAIIEGWTSQLDNQVAMDTLQRVGVPSGAALKPDQVFNDPHLEARGFFETTSHPEVGTYRYYGRPMVFSETPGSTRSPAPSLGEHNRQILEGLLHYPAEEIKQLEDEGVIGTRLTAKMGE